MASGTGQALCAFLSTRGASPCGGAFAPGREDCSTSHSVSLLWSVLTPTPVELQVTPHKPLSHTPLQQAAQEPTGLAQTCATERSRQTPELFPTRKAGGPPAPQGQPGPAAALRPAGDATEVTSTARGGHAGEGPRPHPVRGHTHREALGAALASLYSLCPFTRGPARPLSAPRLRLPHGRPARLPGPRGSGAEVKAGGEPGGRRAGRAGG